MKKISLWAKEHVWATRLIIVFLIYPLFNTTALLTGLLLHSFSIYIAAAWNYPLSLLLLLLIFLYPHQNQKQGKKHGYRYRKMLDVSLASISFLFIVFIGNHLYSQNEKYTTALTYATELPRSHSSYIPTKENKRQKRSLRQLIKSVRRHFREASTGEKIALITLAVLVAFLLIGLLGSLACSISCNGAEGLAMVVFFTGLAGIAILTAWVIHRIVKGPRKKKPETTNI